MNYGGYSRVHHTYTVRGKSGSIAQPGHSLGIWLLVAKRFSA